MVLDKRAGLGRQLRMDSDTAKSMTKRKPRSPQQAPAVPASKELPSSLSDLIGDVKRRIQAAQTRAMTAVNTELVRLYWDIGRMIDERQQQEGWGASVIPRLARELRNELPDVKGFSERNLDRMIAFYRTYPSPADFSPQPVAKLPSSAKVPQAVAKLSREGIPPRESGTIPDSLLWSVPWAHHVVLMEKVKNLTDRLWYLQQTLAGGWSRNNR